MDNFRAGQSSPRKTDFVFLPGILSTLSKPHAKLAKAYVSSSSFKSRVQPIETIFEVSVTKVFRPTVTALSLYT